MARQITVTVHDIAEDGLPDMGDQSLVGRVALIFDGSVVSGWPLLRDEHPQVYARYDYTGTHTLWEADSDVGHTRPLGGVTHWLEFPEPVWEIEKKQRP